MKKIFYSLILLLFISCIQGICQEIQFKTIAEGSKSHIVSKEGANRIVNDRNTFKNLLDSTEHFRISDTLASQVNFDKEIILAVFTGMRSTVCSIEIKKIIETTTTCEVFVEISITPLEALSTSFQIVKTKKTDKKIIFNTKESEF